MLITLASLLFSGCNKKKEEKPFISTENIPVENTTEIFTPKDIQAQIQKSEHKNIKDEQVDKSTTMQATNASDHFTIDDGNSHYEINLINGQFSSSDVNKPVILINLFQPECNACKTQMKYLTKLAKKYQNKLQIITLSDPMEKVDNTRFSDHIKTTLGLSLKSTIPLSILYKEGRYYTHYEGLVPVEMLQYDIEQAIKK